VAGGGLHHQLPGIRQHRAIDLREIGPTYYFAPPRVFEGMLTSVSIRMEDAPPLKQWLYANFMELAKRVGADILDGKPVAPGSPQVQLGLLIYGPLRNVLGLSRIRVAYTAGAAIGPDLFRFFRSIGINLKQLYGQTETCAYVCLQPTGQVKLDTVGQAAPGIELKIADNGEVLVKGVSVLKEYYKRPDATAEVIDADGYFHTGDAGVIDADGHLRIIDRAKDVGKMNRGAMFAPNYIENKLKFFRTSRKPCASATRDEVCAFINIDYEAVGNWAERQGLPYGGYVDLASKPKVLELMATASSRSTPTWPASPAWPTRRSRALPGAAQGAGPDDDELTRTRKVRRNFIADKYGVLVDALYTGKQEQFIETQVKFEDGRTGSVSATLQILDAKTYPAAGRRLTERGSSHDRQKDRRRHPGHQEHQPALRRREGADRHLVQCASTRSAPSSAPTAPARAPCSTASTASTPVRRLHHLPGQTFAT
jgi:long-chain acyl-CoA synthetase